MGAEEARILVAGLSFILSLWLLMAKTEDKRKLPHDQDMGLLQGEEKGFWRPLVGEQRSILPLDEDGSLLDGKENIKNILPRVEDKNNILQEDKRKLPHDQDMGLPQGEGRGFWRPLVGEQRSILPLDEDGSLLDGKENIKNILPRVEDKNNILQEDRKNILPVKADRYNGITSKEDRKSILTGEEDKNNILQGEVDRKNILPGEEDRNNLSISPGKEERNSILPKEEDKNSNTPQEEDKNNILYGEKGRKNFEDQRSKQQEDKSVEKGMQFLRNTGKQKSNFMRDVIL